MGFWVGIKQAVGKVSRGRGWYVEPSYEHLSVGSQTYSFVSLRLTRDFNGPYKPY